MLHLKRCRANSLPRYAKTLLAGSLLSLAFIAPGAAEVSVQHGTVIGVLFSNKSVIVAADSREVDGHNRPVNDRKCKIDALDDAHFFFAFGRTTYADAASKNVLADAHQTARRVFTAAQSVHDVSETWAARMEADLQKVARVDHHSVASGLPSGSIVEGVFGGTDAQGHLTLSKAGVGYSLSVTANIALDHATHDLKLEDEGTLQIYGIAETGPYFGEFLQNRTARVKNLRAKLLRDIDARALGPVDARALTLKTAVEFAIALAKDPRVGGEVSVLVAERGQPIRWFHQAAGCR
jgi:hypothetical protein